MGGGVSMPAVPVSASTEAALKKLYEEKKAAGEEDDAINAARAATDPDQALPSSEWGRLVDRDAADDLDLAELLALTRGEDWREDSADPRDASLASTGPLVLEYQTKRAKKTR